MELVFGLQQTTEGALLLITIVGDGMLLLKARNLGSPSERSYPLCRQRCNYANFVSILRIILTT